MVVRGQTLVLFVPYLPFCLWLSDFSFLVAYESITSLLAHLQDGPVHPEGFKHCVHDVEAQTPSPGCTS